MIAINREYWGILLLGCVASLGLAADQTQWGERYSRNMISQEKGLPEQVDPANGLNVKWIADLGSQTYSTPVIAGGKVYIGTNNNKPRDEKHVGDRGILMCFNEQTGKFLWQLVVPKITTSVYWDWVGAGICSPVTVESNLVYGVTSRGEVVCLDPEGMANGNQGPYMDEARHSSPEGSPVVEVGPNDADILWLYDTINELGIRQHDSAQASILLDGRFLYLNTSNGVDDTHRHIASPNAPSLIVLDKMTGKLVATDNERIGSNTVHCTWASPSLGFVNGRKLIFYAGPNAVVYGFEPITEVKSEVQKLKKVWSFDCDPTAPKTNVHRYMSNRKESASTIHAMPVFVDGRLYVAGGGDIWWGKREAWLKCIDATLTGDVTTTAEKWSYPLNRHTLSTPAVWNGLVFTADAGQKIHCVDAVTGKPYWTHDIQGEIWSSPLVADGKVYVGTQRKELIILAASKEKRLLSTTLLDSPISGSPVAANGTLYVSTHKKLYAFALPKKKE
jgi:outer membrane protein assembly factor BamB